MVTPSVSLSHSAPHPSPSVSVTISKTAQVTQTPQVTPSNTMPDPYNNYVLAWYRFGDSTGWNNLLDYSCNYYDLTTVLYTQSETYESVNTIGAQTKVPKTVYGDALSFIPIAGSPNLSYSVARTANFPDATILTFIGWFKTKTTSGSDSYLFTIENHNYNQTRYAIGITSSGYLYLNIGGTVFKNLTPFKNKKFNDGLWHNVVFQIDTTDISANGFVTPYIGLATDLNTGSSLGYLLTNDYKNDKNNPFNGLVSGSFPALDSTTRNYQNSIYIGAKFIGAVDEFMFHKIILSQAQATALLNNPSLAGLCITATPTNTPTQTPTPSHTPTNTPSPIIKDYYYSIIGNVTGGIDAYTLATNPAYYGNKVSYTQVWNGYDRARIHITINRNVVVSSASIGVYSFVVNDTFNSTNTTVYLTNNGLIAGAGGAGGAPNSNGGGGGPALYVGAVTYLNNDSGSIFGGGGGGAGGASGVAVYSGIGPSCNGDVPCGYVTSQKGCFICVEQNGSCSDIGALAPNIQNCGTSGNQTSCCNNPRYSTDTICAGEAYGRGGYIYTGAGAKASSSSSTIFDCMRQGNSNCKTYSDYANYCCYITQPCCERFHISSVVCNAIGFDYSGGYGGGGGNGLVGGAGGGAYFLTNGSASLPSYLQKYIGPTATVGGYGGNAGQKGYDSSVKTGGPVGKSIVGIGNIHVISGYNGYANTSIAGPTS